MQGVYDEEIAVEALVFDGVLLIEGASPLIRTAALDMVEAA